MILVSLLVTNKVSFQPDLLRVFIKQRKIQKDAGVEVSR